MHTKTVRFRVNKLTKRGRFFRPDVDVFSPSSFRMDLFPWPFFPSGPIFHEPFFRGRFFRGCYFRGPFSYIRCSAVAMVTQLSE